jgi:hypothetical protein
LPDLTKLFKHTFCRFACFDWSIYFVTFRYFRTGSQDTLHFWSHCE